MRELTGGEERAEALEGARPDEAAALVRLHIRFCRDLLLDKVQRQVGREGVARQELGVFERLLPGSAAAAASSWSS